MNSSRVRKSTVVRHDQVGDDGRVLLPRGVEAMTIAFLFAKDRTEPRLSAPLQIFLPKRRPVKTYEMGL